MLLNFLAENPASVEVENAYLKRYRERLGAIVSGQPTAIAAHP
jgi:hypothetical protein